MSEAVIVNGRPIVPHGPVTTTLQEMLRDQAGLTGTKSGCAAGECGACNVLLDGALARSCLLLAADLGGCAVTTIEGIGGRGNLSLVQQAMVDSGAIQCGFCTPGMVIAATALLDTTPDPTAGEVRAGLAGTLCRCSGYVKIVEAVLLAARRRREVAA